MPSRRFGLASALHDGVSGLRFSSGQNPNRLGESDEPGREPGHLVAADECFPAFLDEERHHSEGGDRIGPPPPEHGIEGETG